MTCPFFVLEENKSVVKTIGKAVLREEVE